MFGFGRLLGTRVGWIAAAQVGDSPLGAGRNGGVERVAIGRMPDAAEQLTDRDHVRFKHAARGGGGHAEAHAAPLFCADRITRHGVFVGRHVDQLNYFFGLVAA